MKRVCVCVMKTKSVLALLDRGANVLCILCIVLYLYKAVQDWRINIIKMYHLENIFSSYT